MAGFYFGVSNKIDCVPFKSFFFSSHLVYTIIYNKAPTFQSGLYYI
jgi:hypothetical protein